MKKFKPSTKRTILFVSFNVILALGFWANLFLGVILSGILTFLLALWFYDANSEDSTYGYARIYGMQAVLKARKRVLFALVYFGILFVGAFLFYIYVSIKR